MVALQKLKSVKIKCEAIKVAKVKWWKNIQLQLAIKQGKILSRILNLKHEKSVALLTSLK